MFLPSRDAVQTIMVLDLCGSSELSRQNEVMAVHLKRRLEQISGTIIADHKANSFKNTGDGFLATFPDCAKAVTAAMEIMDSLRQRNRMTVNPPIHVRIALHYGKTYFVFDSGTKEIYGHDVNIAFRVENVQAAAFKKLEAQFPERDRILCTRQFHDAAQKQPALPKVRFTPCGQVQVKGIDEPVDVLWVQAADDRQQRN